MISAAIGDFGVVSKHIGFSAIARSVMISACLSMITLVALLCFSAIARSVMISAARIMKDNLVMTKFQCYSS